MIRVVVRSQEPLSKIDLTSCKSSTEPRAKLIWMGNAEIPTPALELHATPSKHVLATVSATVVSVTI